MANFAPLVHGRTLKLDFRSKFIASPSDFDETAVEWARRYVLAMTASSVLYKLEDTDLWWSIFSNKNYTVSGVLCRAKCISRDCVTDGSRELYAYLGLVAKQPTQFVPEMAIEYFAPLYDYVRARWNESADADLHAANPVDYREFNIPESVACEETLDLNRSPNAIALWPLEDKVRVWSLAHQLSTPVIVGAPFIGEIKKGLYPNVCSPDVLTRRVEPLRIERERNQTRRSISPKHFVGRDKSFYGENLENQLSTRDERPLSDENTRSRPVSTRVSVIDRLRQSLGRLTNLMTRDKSRSRTKLSFSEEPTSRVERELKQPDER